MNLKISVVSFSLVGAALLAFAGSAAAHEGPRVWIGNVGGKITTYTSDDDLDPSEYLRSRVFAGQVGLNFGVYQTDFPGYEVRQDGGGVAVNTQFGFNITAPLLYYEPGNNRFRQTQYAFPSPPTQTGVSLGATLRKTSSTPVSGFSFFNFGGIGAHAHLVYTMLGDGNSPTVAPQDGIYALQLNLTSPTLATSDTYFLLFGVNRGPADTEFVNATALANSVINAIPGDANFDGRVDTVDFNKLLSGFGTSSNWSTGDFTYDGSTTSLDFALLVSHFGESSVAAGLPGAVVPEPTGAGLIICLASLPGMRRRR